METTAPHLSPFVYLVTVVNNQRCAHEIPVRRLCRATISRVHARFLLGNLDLALNSFSEQVLGDGFVPLSRECVSLRGK